MGYLHYGSDEHFEFDDDVLNHLRTVVVTKFVQQECFIFTWSDAVKQRSIWLHPGQYLSFEFSATEVPAVRREWANELLVLANSPGGLRLNAPQNVPRVKDENQAANKISR